MNYDDLRAWAKEEPEGPIQRAILALLDENVALRARAEYAEAERVAARKVLDSLSAQLEALGVHALGSTEI